MKEALDTLARAVQEATSRLVDFSDEDAGRHPAGGGWSAKQILGHLIDSAGNNHQRWVRALAGPVLEFPQYDQEFWVAAQGYDGAPWPDLVNLWLLYNRHLLHIAARIPAEKLPTACVIGDNPPIALESLVTGYVDHLQHHLDQIFARRAAAS
jgi:DinB family protein